MTAQILPFRAHSFRRGQCSACLGIFTLTSDGKLPVHRSQEGYLYPGPQCEHPGRLAMRVMEGVR